MAIKGLSEETRKDQTRVFRGAFSIFFRLAYKVMSEFSVNLNIRPIFSVWGLVELSLNSALCDIIFPIQRFKKKTALMKPSDLPH